MLTPIGDKLLIELDPLPKVTPSGLHLAEEDTIRYCKRCDARQERLSEVSCYPTDEYRYSRSGRGIEHVERHYTHDIEVVRAEVVVVKSRWGSILRVGPRVRDLAEGMRVLVDCYAGGSMDDVRQIRASEVLALEVE